MSTDFYYKARFAQAEKRIDALEAEIATLRRQPFVVGELGPDVVLTDELLDETNAVAADPDGSDAA